ncbi:VOC family protein [Brevibacillus brevis]|uniref:VOC family protein n=1 Tax=Brevibacillus brevis TaxID=1393 RepID=UPI0025A59605|nr:VOC family protein [Brevibacillus brevis]WJQ80051.1 VOC family protein [Brevibacillus brevis]
MVERRRSRSRAYSLSGSASFGLYRYGRTSPADHLLAVDKIHEVYEELKSKGIEVSEMTYKRGGGYSFRFRDPDGHLNHLWGGWPSAEDEERNA